MDYNVEVNHQAWHEWNGSECDGSCPYATSPVQGVAEVTAWAKRAYMWRRRAWYILVFAVFAALALLSHLLLDHS